MRRVGIIESGRSHYSRVLEKASKRRYGRFGKIGVGEGANQRKIPYRQK